MTSKNKNVKKLIGRTEKADFPSLNLYQLATKIDTGAYTSSLHCHHIELGREKKFVSFYLLDPSHPEYNNRQFTCPVEDVRTIRSSNGAAEERIVIKTKIKLLDCLNNIELSLTDRSEMRYPVLLGRKFLRNKFIVDVSKNNLRK